jgi:hypothetical protein
LETFLPEIKSPGSDLRKDEEGKGEQNKRRKG